MTIHAIDSMIYIEGKAWKVLSCFGWGLRDRDELHTGFPLGHRRE